MNSNPAMIVVEQLTKQFADLRTGPFTALDHVSFQVKPGEVFGLLGPNGAGKTTCLRILSTVLKPTSGRALVAGYDVATNPQEVRARTGFLSNNTGIYDRMTAWEMVEHFGRLYGIPEPVLQERLAVLFDRLADRKPSRTTAGGPSVTVSTGRVPESVIVAEDFFSRRKNADQLRFFGVNTFSSFSGEFEGVVMSGGAGTSGAVTTCSGSRFPSEPV